MKILFVLWKKGEKRPIRRYGTNPRVLGRKLASFIFQKAFLKVTYGWDIDVFGRKVEFANEGYYFNKKDLQQAFRAFCEIRRPI